MDTTKEPFVHWEVDNVTFLYKDKDDNKIKKHAGNTDNTLFQTSIFELSKYYINNDYNYLYITKIDTKDVQIYAEFYNRPYENFLTSNKVMAWKAYSFTENGKRISGNPCRYFIYRAYNSDDDNIDYYAYHLYRFKIEGDGVDTRFVYKIIRLDEADLDSDNLKGIKFISKDFDIIGIKPNDFVVDEKFIYILAGKGSSNDKCFINDTGEFAGDRIYRYDHTDINATWLPLSIQSTRNGEEGYVCLSNDRKFIYGLCKRFENSPQIYKIN